LSEAVQESRELLLPRVARGDQAATRECIARFGGLVWSIAKRLMIPASQIEDAVQDVFIEVWKNAERYDEGIASEATFVAMIARRRLIDRLRKNGRQMDVRELTEGVEADARAGGWRGQGGEASDVSRQVVSEEAMAASQALDQLSVDQQRVLRLSIYRGLSHELIARVLGLPLGTVKTHARRGLLRLRELLSTSGDSGADGSTSHVRVALRGSPKGGAA
jgi:RNA polymerase sigma-70 factor (ECF subfamily)